MQIPNATQDYIWPERRRARPWEPLKPFSQPPLRREEPMAEDMAPAQPAFLGETGQDVPEGTFSTTETPTTTGTVGGEFYRLSSPSRKPLGQVGDRDVQNAMDAAMLFAPADITLNMSQVERGAGDWLRKLGAQEAQDAREGLRYATRAANREPLKGPQDVETRVDLVQAAAGGPSKFRGRLSRYLTEQTQDPNSPFNQALHGQHAPEAGPEPSVTFSESHPRRGEAPSLRERLFGKTGQGKKQAPLAIKSAPLPPGATPERLWTPEGQDWLYRFSNKFGPARKDAMLKDFTVRRQLDRLGWKPADVEDLPLSRIEDILSGETPNLGQGPKWIEIDAGRQAEAARRAASNQEGVQLTAQAKYLNDLRDQALEEAVHYPLERVYPDEPWLYPLNPPK